MKVKHGMQKMRMLLISVCYCQEFDAVRKCKEELHTLVSN